MLLSGGIIKTNMLKRGFKHRRTEDQFSIQGEYARNLQYVYSKEHKIDGGIIIDLVYFSVDVLNENLVMGLYRENTAIENGVYINTSRSLGLEFFNAENVEKELSKLIPSTRDRLT